MKLLRIFLAVLASAAGVAATYLVSAGVNNWWAVVVALLTVLVAGVILGERS